MALLREKVAMHPVAVVPEGAEMDPHQTDRLTLYGSFTSSSSYKPMLYLALARLPFSFRTVNLKTGVQKTSEYLAVNRWGVCRRCATAA